MSFMGVDSFCHKCKTLRSFHFLLKCFRSSAVICLGPFLALSSFVKYFNKGNNSLMVVDFSTGLNEEGKSGFPVADDGST